MAISSVAQHIDNGEEILRNSVELARRHNRLYCFRMTMNRLQQRRKGATLVSKHMDSWYDLLSGAVPNDTKPKSKARSVAPSLGSILAELLYDPLFTYRSLQGIPGRVLLEHCISHSYEHVADKINLNNPSTCVGPQDIIGRIEHVLHDPAVWDIATTTTQTSANEKMRPLIEVLTIAPAKDHNAAPTPDDYFKRCANCIDMCFKACTVKRVEGKAQADSLDSTVQNVHR